MTYDIPGYGLIRATPSTSQGVVQEFPGGDLPEWINSSKNRLAITTEAGRLTVTRNRAEVFRYFTGWELFFFTLDSPYHGMGRGELAGRALDGEARAILSDFWNNSMWRHGDVFWAIFETVLMAFLGTMGAAIVALPMAFLAARNFTPIAAVRFGFRRLFDFVRGVDALIWTIILTRAFGLGPLTGALAILLTDSGTFGKLFSEARENGDEKQIEGVQSTGAKPLQRYRFGVIPQITPVLLSQVLYYLESNTRSATIIGAITGGGIGLLLTQAIITQKDWEEVTYYIVLVVLMVIFMDWVSGWLRRRLIASDDSGL
jgi:phosphonate transport system permease protein